MTSLGDLVNEWVDWYSANYPTKVAFAGDEAYGHTLGDFSAEAFLARERDAGEWIRRLEQQSERGADVDDLVDRDLILTWLRAAAIEAERPAWRTSPHAYLDHIAVPLFAAFLPPDRDEPELVKALISRLDDVPAMTAACGANLEADQAWRHDIGGGAYAARSTAASLTTKLSALVSDADLRGRVAEAAAPAAEALVELAAHLDSVTSTAQGDWRLGETRYSKLLRQRELLDMDVAELHQRGREWHSELVEQMKVVTGRTRWIGRTRWARASWPVSEKKTLADYANHVRRARQFVLDRELIPPLPEDEGCEVVVPLAWLDAPPIVSYRMPPLLGQDVRGRLSVPVPTSSMSARHTALVLQQTARHWRPTVTAHETYPGHHWHLIMLITRQERTLRKLVHSQFFVEGWGTYAEKLMLEEGYFAKRPHLIAYLDDQVTRAARVVIDTGLHAGLMSESDATDFLRTQTSLSVPQIQLELGRVRQYPTGSAAYYTGAEEICAIRDSYLKRGGTLQQFHVDIASSGAMPLALARRAVFDRPATQP